MFCMRCMDEVAMLGVKQWGGGINKPTPSAGSLAPAILSVGYLVRQSTGVPLVSSAPSSGSEQLCGINCGGLLTKTLWDHLASRWSFSAP